MKLRNLYLAAFLFLVSSLASADIFVGPTAQGAGSCASFANRCTVASGLALFSSGTSNIIHFDVGNYGATSPNIVKNGASPTQRLVLQCDQGVASAYTAVGKCTFTGGFTISGNNVDIIGFDIGNNPNLAFCTDGINSGGQTSPTGNSVHIIGNYCHDLGGLVVANGITGCPQNGAIAIQNAGIPTDQQILRNIIVRFGGNGGNQVAGCNTAQGISGEGNPIIVQNNIIASITVGGITLHDACNWVVSNNTIVNTQDPIILSSLGPCLFHGLNTFDNNLIAGARVSTKIFNVGATAHCDASHPNLYSHNISDGPPPNDFGTGFPASCETVTPLANPLPNPFVHQVPTSMFVNYKADGTGDYHLKAGSAAIQTGGTGCVTGGFSPCVPSKDFDGVVRTNPPSVGAYDFVPVGGSPTLVLTPSPVAFGNVSVGSSLGVGFLLQNTGTATANGISVFLASIVPIAGDITVASSCGLTLTAGNQCSGTVTFLPTDMGAYTGTLNASSSNATTATVNITGTGIAPTISVAPTSVAFGNVSVNSTVAGSVVTITNTGTDVMKIFGFSFSTGDTTQFSQSSDCPISPSTLAISASCHVTPSFTPTSTGAKATNLVISSNSFAGSSVAVPLSGTGIKSNLTASPVGPVVFTDTNVGATSLSTQITITNNGTGPTVNLTSATTGDFLKTSTDCPSALTTSTSCHVFVAFHPTVGGPRTGSLNVSSNDGGAVSVVLDGNGIVPTNGAVFSGGITLTGGVKVLN